ncbi:hypothetical protein DSO57_1034076 [Entomophthora muscae]|uniref:Uncharacterized protein n=1 Tax=Entomophthora muscae TaxID=34485 RepID=A0ACC2ULJ6_9FUNG|nr:hypothetical protein DSO57_1034076 [Entomophthora muscae]
MELMEYNFELKHIPGKLNQVADGLSRQFSLLTIQQTPFEDKLGEVFQALENGILPKTKQAQEFLLYCTRFTVLEGKLYLKQKSQLREIPRPDQQELTLTEAHNEAGHFR